MGNAEQNGLDDAELVSRAGRGDHAAREMLVRRHLPAAYAVAFARMGERADAEDVVQDAMVQALQRLAECRDPTRFAAWLIRIVRNRAYDVQRRQRVRRAESIDNVPEPPAPERSNALAERNEAREHLTVALRSLTHLQREVLLLHDLEGWPHAELAGQLGITEGSARVHLFNARTRVRAALADRYALAAVG